MNTNKTEAMRKVWVNTGHLESMITGVSELSWRLWHEAYSMTPQGILHNHKDMTEGQNAIDYVNQYSELTGAALQLIYSSMGILSDMLTNGDAAIVFTEDMEDSKED